MYRESLITIPKADNDGVPLNGVMKSAQAFLIDAFGGCTVSEAFGSWRNADGVVMSEPVWQLVTAYEPDANNDATLHTLATNVGKLARQQAVYVRYASGDVEIIDTAHNAPLALHSTQVQEAA